MPINNHEKFSLSMEILYRLRTYECFNKQENSLFVTYLLITIIVFLSTRINPIHAYRSSPDIGLCETIKNKTPISIECIRGQENFCCNTELLSTTDNVTKWGKRCCTEAEFVLQNA